MDQEKELTFTRFERMKERYPNRSAVVYLVEFGPVKILFGQDVHGPLDPSLLSDRDDYRNSLNFMLDLDADILCEGHFGIYRGKDTVKEFIGSFLHL